MKFRSQIWNFPEKTSLFLKSGTLCNFFKKKIIFQLWPRNCKCEKNKIVTKAMTISGHRENLKYELFKNPVTVFEVFNNPEISVTTWPINGTFQFFPELSALNYKFRSQKYYLKLILHFSVTFFIFRPNSSFFSHNLNF